MSLDEILSNPPPKQLNNAGCSIGHWLHSLDEEKRESIRKAFADDAWQDAPLYRTLNEHVAEIPCGVTAFRRHRNGGCACDKVGLR